MKKAFKVMRVLNVNDILMQYNHEIMDVFCMIFLNLDINFI